MCGIVGTLHFTEDEGKVDPNLLTRMRDALRHRGPDGAGIWISPDGLVGLGHRRLSIIDLSQAAAQPMCNEDGTIQIVFNGEIYNHSELRRELEATGKHRWKTDHSDTEVIIHAYEQWGIECLNRFRGMFAIAIWDGRHRELWLVRDRLGIKPLYYTPRSRSVSFASEIKALLVNPTQPRAVDEESLFHYLSFLTSPAPKTLFEGIYKVPNACFLHVNRNGETRLHKYWDVWDYVEPLSADDEEDIQRRLLAELRTSVKLRKLSDVPVGVFLSGGLDSSTNAVLFSEGEETPVRTFSIGYDREYESCQNEFSYARIVADRVKSDHKERRLSASDLTSFLPKMVYLHDEPLADPVSVPIYYLAAMARESGVIVAQCGEGADELFFGYAHWKKILCGERLSSRCPEIVKHAGVHLLKQIGKEGSIYSEWLRRGIQRVPLFWGGAEGFLEHHKQQILGARLKRQFSGRTSWEAIEPLRTRFQQAAWDPSPINWMAYLDLHIRLPELLLMRLDKMTMAVSLEGRVPFLDHKFVELAFSIPSALRFRHGELKYILKRAVRDVLPSQILNRTKQGFGVPIQDWLLADLGAAAQKLVNEFCVETNLLDANSVSRFLSGHSGPYLWHLLNLAMWWKRYVYSD